MSIKYGTLPINPKRVIIPVPLLRILSDNNHQPLIDNNGLDLTDNG